MYQSQVDYLNLEYILVKAYGFVAGFHWTLGTLPGWAVTLGTTVVVVGMVMSLLMLLLIVYSQIRLLQVEHAGFHALESHAVHEHQEHLEHEEETSTVQTERWRHIMELSTSANHGDWRRAILEADIMLSDALASAGYVASTVGEQLKLTNPLQVTSIRSAWDAHMLRNRIAHGGESVELSVRDVQTAIQNYKRVFEELGFI